MKFKNYYHLDTIEPFGDIIKGDTGKQGYTGFVGESGGTGLKGLTGAIGPDGLRGAPGIEGGQGNRGDIGDPGLAGNSGKQGSKGNMGSFGPSGPSGPNGPRGDRGDIGPRGNTGIKGRLGLEGPKGDSGMSFSNNTIDQDIECEGGWRPIPAAPDLVSDKNYCPKNHALSGIKTRKWNARIQYETSYKSPFLLKCMCRRTRWRTNNSLTHWQSNKSYNICCSPMPVKEDGTMKFNESDNENIDQYYGSTGSDDPSSLLYNLSLEEIRDRSLSNYPFHSPL
jgi:hypothetical protein